MGYFRHHAIIVTDYDQENLERAHTKAVEIFSSPVLDYQGSQHLCWVSPISPPGINGYRTFFVGPDGSKEGWEPSDEADRRRKQFTDWLQAEIKKWNFFKWADVAYYDEGGEPAIEDASCLHSEVDEEEEED